MWSAERASRSRVALAVVFAGSAFTLAGNWRVTNARDQLAANQTGFGARVGNPGRFAAAVVVRSAPAQRPEPAAAR